MLNLSDITLICVDDSDNYINSKNIFEIISNRIKFFDCKFFNSKLKNSINLKVPSIKQYNEFLVKDLNNYVESPYCLVIQADGYPINFDSWDYHFLKYDYIGAPWYMQPWPLEVSVGNGGFSLRSKKFLEESSKLKDYDGEVPEDAYLCRMKYKDLKVKFAPHDVAYKFSVEDMPYKGQFGFHGKNTIALNKHYGIFNNK